MYHRYYEIPTAGSQYNPRIALSTNKRNYEQKISIDETTCLMQLRPEIPNDHPLFEGLVQLDQQQAQVIARSTKYVVEQP